MCIKKIIPFFLIFIWSCRCLSQTQVGIYGIYSQPVLDLQSKNYKGGFGGSLEIFSDDLTDTADNFQLRIGGALSFADQRSSKHRILLDTPNNDPGEITYSNWTTGLNGIVKFVFPRSSAFHPYCDVFMGIRAYTSREKIESDKIIQGYDKITYSYPGSGTKWDMGASLGFLIPLSKNAFFDFRTSFAYSPTKIKFVDLSSVVNDNNNISYNLQTTRPALVIFRAGFLFNLRPGYLETNRGSHSSPYKSTPYKSRESKPLKPKVIKPGT
jgi:hypothetical protein